jgi:hypothetical protein
MDSESEMVRNPFKKYAGRKIDMIDTGMLGDVID